MSDLFKEAIAEAKTVRQTAMQNAKLALEEAFTPKIKKILSKKLNESFEEEGIDEGFGDEDDDIDLDDDDAKFLDNIKNDKGADKAAKLANKDINADKMPEDDKDEWSDEDEIDLDEIIRELEGDGSDDKIDEELDEVDEDLNESTEDLDEAKEDDEDDDKEDDADAEIAADDKEPKEEKLKDLTVADFTAMIKELIAQEMGGGNDKDDTEGDDIDLNEMSDDNLDEMSDDDVEDSSEPFTKVVPGSMAAQLREARKTINTMKNEMSSVNLINAKLLYLNKILKENSLSDTQKSKVLAQMDKASTVKEAKLLYSTLSETLKNSPKRTNLKENLGFASKPAGNVNRRVITENNIVDVATVSRLQKLAGIK